MTTLCDILDERAAPARTTLAAAPMLSVTVRAIRPLTPRISAFELAPDGPAPLPPFTPGAHIGIDLPVHGSMVRRSYSLVNAAGQGHYEIAVLREDKGAGGSLRMHNLRVGSRLKITPPKNAFPLDDTASPALLIAGGIGITPILAMARALEAAGRPYALHYATRMPEDMAYREEAGALAAATLYFDQGDPEKGLPLDRLLAAHDGRHVYVCGPAPLIRAVLKTCTRNGWPEASVHHELFTGSLTQSGDRAFELEMRSSGIVRQVPAGMSILDAVISEGVFAPFECRRGECGMCTTPVIDGAVDHRDHYLTDDERAAGDTMCICVSRAAGERLVLDL